MSYGLYISAAGADVQSKRLDVMANNLANVDTTGFKRELVILRLQKERIQAAAMLHRAQRIGANPQAYTPPESIAQESDIAKFRQVTPLCFYI